MDLTDLTDLTWITGDKPRRIGVFAPDPDKADYLVWTADDGPEMIVRLGVHYGDHSMPFDQICTVCGTSSAPDFLPGTDVVLVNGRREEREDALELLELMSRGPFSPEPTYFDEDA